MRRYTTRMIDMLKARGETPRSVMAKLGLDASLLNDPELRSSERNGRFDPRDHTGGGGPGVAGDDVVVDPMMGNEKSYDQDPPLVHPASKQNLGSDDSDYDDFRGFFSSSRASFPARTAADPSHVKVNEEFGTERQQHPGDACPSLSAAVVAAVMRDPWNCSPSCDAFRRFDRSDASSSALSSFGQQVQLHI
jgi:hypothetical protein